MLVLEKENVTIPRADKYERREGAAISRRKEEIRRPPKKKKKNGSILKGKKDVTVRRKKGEIKSLGRS